MTVDYDFWVRLPGRQDEGAFQGAKPPPNDNQP